MDSIEDYVRKNSVEELLEKVSEFVQPKTEQHEFPKNSKVKTDDWFQFLNKLNQTGRDYHIDLPVVEFNYIQVEDEAVKYVESNAPVGEDELTKHVENNVESASKEQGEDWIFSMMVTTDDFNDNDEIVSLDRSFDDDIY